MRLKKGAYIYSKKHKEGGKIIDIFYDTNGEPKKYKVELKSGKVVEMTPEEINDKPKYVTRFAKIPEDVQLLYKIGDEVDFNTTKGVMKGKVVLYNYVEAKHDILYRLRLPDSDKTLNVYQTNIVGLSNSANSAMPISMSVAEFSQNPIVSPTKEEEFFVTDSPELYGKIIEHLPDGIVKVILKDSTGIIIPEGKEEEYELTLSDLTIKN